MAKESARRRVDGLFELARDKSTEGRTALAAAVSDLFFDADDPPNEQERALMSDILRRLVHDIEMTVRRYLSERLADQKNAPRDLILTLANDEIGVAQPILERSSVLRDSELIEIIRARTTEHRMAIAIRRSVAEPVADALVESGEEDVILRLLENPNARISAATMAYLVEESKRVDAFQNPIVRRHDLPPELAARMYWWVSAALRRHILDNFDIDPADLDDSLEATIRHITGAGRRKESVVTDRTLALAERLDRIKAITPQFMIQVLRNGEVPLFHALFARFTGLPVKLVSRFIYEPGGEALAVACKASGVEKGDFASLYLLSRKARPGADIVDPGELSGLLELFERMDLEAANRIVRRWRRDPAFVDAIERVDGPRSIAATS